MNNHFDTTLRPVAVVFDMDGLIFDTERLYFEAEHELLARRGCSFPTSLGQRMMGLPGLAAMELLRQESGLTEAPEQLFQECQALFQAKLDGDLCYMPGFPEYFDRVQAQGLRLGLATSTLRQLTDRMLGPFGLHERFECILTGSDVSRGKPDPEIYQRTCERLQLPPEQVLVLEDSLNGTLAAKAAGCLCAAIPHQLSRSLDFSHVDLVVDHVLDERLLALTGL